MADDGAEEVRVLRACFRFWTLTVVLSGRA